MKSAYCRLIALALAAVVSASCIRDEIEPCPPLQVMIDIEDKNYDNIDTIESQTGLEHRIDESLSFRSYIRKLFYALYDLESGKVVAVRHLHEVTGDAAQATALLPADLPFGRYGLMVWGNINSEEGILADGRYDTYDLHAGGVEGYDVYMTADELLYDEQNYRYVVSLKRLKGKLIIQAEGFPAAIGWSRKIVSDVMGNVDFGFHYSETEDVTTERSWSGRTTNYVSSTFLSPSAEPSGSRIEALLYDRPEMDVPAISLPTVSATLRRNEITVLRYAYDAHTGTSNIFILLNDGWNEIIHLEN